MAVVLDPGILLLQLGILLAVAYLLGRLAERIGLPAATGELATGLLLGPSVLGSVAAAQGGAWLFTPATGQDEFLRGIAAFCGVLLVGVAGATVDVRFVRAKVRTVALIGVGALALPLLSTVAIALAADPRLRGPEATTASFAVFAGLALSVSAVPVIVKIFADLRVLHRDLSQLSLSVAVLDDATVWVGLSIIAAAVHLQNADGAGSLSGDLGLTLGALAVLVVMTVVARRTTGGDRLGTASTVGGPARVLDGDSSVGASCLVAAAFIVLGAVVSDGIGLDSTLGAFVCGVIVASGRIVPVARLRPLRTIVLGVFAPLFLAVNGLAADLTALQDPRLALTAAAAVALAVVSKSLGAYGGGRLAGLDHDRSMAVSSALNARGTVQLVVAAAGLSLGLITTEGFTILVLVALVTSAMAGPLIRRYMRRIPETEDEERRENVVD
ncbi:MAG TPA: cation:proton antiporter [Microlunatus sp.]|jgi:Kef-type K+ transport system membrane component KefB|nr:cation:proton antiporter [Microlunatus sp.]